MVYKRRMFRKIYFNLENIIGVSIVVQLNLSGFSYSYEFPTATINGQQIQINQKGK